MVPTEDFLRVGDTRIHLFLGGRGRPLVILQQKLLPPTRDLRRGDARKMVRWVRLRTPATDSAIIGHPSWNRHTREPPNRT